MRELGENEFTIQFYEAYETERSIYLILEYLPGSTLLDTFGEIEFDENDI